MIEFGHGTHVGLRRPHNEDTYCAEPELGLWLVADGMGGHELGEVASALARDTVAQFVNEGQGLAQTLSLRPIVTSFITLRLAASLCPMGTTVVAVKINGNEYEGAWVGDSRIYRWNGDLTQLSSDHSYVQELIEQGAISAEQARTHPNRNVVTQALGVTEPESLKVETVSGTLEPGEYLLLCSDGLTEEVDDDGIADILKQDLSAQESVDHLILAALDHGGSDNVTVVLLGRKS